MAAPTLSTQVGVDPTQFESLDQQFDFPLPTPGAGDTFIALHYCRRDTVLDGAEMFYAVNAGAGITAKIVVLLEAGVVATDTGDLTDALAVDAGALSHQAFVMKVPTGSGTGFRYVAPEESVIGLLLSGDASAMVHPLVSLTLREKLG